MEYMSSVENIEYDQLIENIDYVWNNREELKIRLIELDQHMRNKALKNTHMALELLKSR